MALDRLRQTFFDGYLDRHPEEACTLGVYGGAGRLRDHEATALDDERRWFSAMDRELGAATASNSDEELDLVAMRRVANHHLHTWDRLWCAVDWSIYPYSMVMTQHVHAQSPPEWQAIASQVGAIPRFLEQHEANVARGMSDGVRPDGALCSFFADRLIPPASASLRALSQVGDAGALAADAYDRHAAWLRETVLPGATEAHRLGEDELGWRLRHQLGIEAPVVELIERATAELERTQEQLVARAASIDVAVSDLDGVRDLTAQLQEASFARDDEVEPTYRAFVARALDLVKERRLFNVPEHYELGIAPLAPAFAAVGFAGVNWPAPLLDTKRLGHFMVAPEAASHPRAWAADLTVHEAFPGHHLQSFWWQQHFNRHPAPVRFLLVHDQVAIPRHYWAPMLNIEGYAVYAEELMRQAGFFSPTEELLVLVAHAIRAARVIVDLSLHSGVMDTDEAVAFLTREACLREPHAKNEVRRYLQVPLQASTYLLGRLTIEDIVADARAREGDDFDIAATHDTFFSYGPADPASIRRTLNADPTPS